jgi:hypothetical protein
MAAPTGRWDGAGMSNTPLPPTAFMYEASDVPPGMTLDAYRRRASEKPRKRRRVIRFPRIDVRNPLGSVLPVPRTA